MTGDESVAVQEVQAILSVGLMLNPLLSISYQLDLAGSSSCFDCLRTMPVIANDRMIW
jgi:hypothetical protein